MKIKHFHGYGTVDAVRIGNKKVNENERRLLIRVVGNHERGIIRNDKYDVYNWLVKRFCRNCLDYRQVRDVFTYPEVTLVGNVPTDACLYSIHYYIDK